MALLTNADRHGVWAYFMRNNTEPLDLAKQDLRAAVNAVDQFLHDNAAALNSAIPQPARTALSVEQKARLLNYVVLERYVKGA